MSRYRLCTIVIDERSTRWTSTFHSLEKLRGVAGRQVTATHVACAIENDVSDETAVRLLAEFLKRPVRIGDADHSRFFPTPTVPHILYVEANGCSVGGKPPESS